MAKFTRTQKATNVSPIGRVVRRNGCYVGFVKDTSDAQKMGRLRVWIPEFGSRPDDVSGWITVSYASPFAGATDPAHLDPNVQLGDKSQTSYGWWAVPPDLENQVLVMFINGDPSRGVWIGCLYQQYMNHMVPGIAAASNYHAGQPLPVTEYNKRTTEKIRDDIKRPKITEHAAAIASQGLIKDTIRGITDTSARRETPSQVYGLVTPGPKIDEATLKDGKTVAKHRKGGHQFYFDDGEGSEHFRVRTRGGAQVLLDETNGIVYAINKAGTAWIQMDAEGNVDIFGAKSFSVRSQENINLYADQNINLEAKAAINIKAGATTKLHSVGALDIKTNATANLTAVGSLTLKSDAAGIISVAGKASINSSGCDIESGGPVNIDGSVIRLNDGAANAPSGSAAQTPQPASKTNVLSSFSDPDKFTRQTAQVQTIVARFPTFEPCPEHSNKGN